MQLIHGDCLVALSNLEDETINLTVTSPPYDNLRDYNGGISQWNEDKWKSIIQELYRVTKPNGTVVWVVNDATIKGSETGTSFKQALWAKECGFNLHDTMIYNKGSSPFPCKTRYYQSFEYMFVWSKGTPNFYPLKDRKNKSVGRPMSMQKSRQKDGSLNERVVWDVITEEYGVRFNVWDISCGYNKSTTDKIAYDHPAIFPEKLAHDHILSWSKWGDTVLDPFMGSGTTGKMAKKLNRFYIGIELDEIYFNIAKQRIDVV